jgi:hypothetical protein
MSVLNSSAPEIYLATDARDARRHLRRFSDKLSVITDGLVEIMMYQQILVQLPNIKSHENPFSWSLLVTCGQTD